MSSTGCCNDLSVAAGRVQEVARWQADKPRGSTRAAHYQDSDHPVIQSFEPGEDWCWCYVDATIV